MRYTILGFSQEKAIEYDLDMTDLLLLDYIQRANGTPNMEHIIENDVTYVWLSHTKIHEDLPILKLSEGTLKNRLGTLKEKGLIQSIQTHVKTKRGSKTFYSITELITSFQNDVITTENEQSRHFKMTSDNILNSNIDNKLNISNNKLLDISTAPTIESKLYSPTKTDKPKKKNLWDKCLEEIQNFSNNPRLNDILIMYLEYRLEVKEKPLYANQWKGMLKKLDDIATENNQDMIDIVQQSIDAGWLSFYPIKKVSKRNIATVSSEFGEVVSEKSDKEEEQYESRLF